MTMFDDAFLEARARAVMPTDSAHDWWHVRRVWRLAQRIARTEPTADMRVLQVAVFFHDVMPKRPEGGHAPVTAAWLADALAPLDAPPLLLERAAEAINTHSFSRGAPPTSIEGAILQDADRLDAMGAIGIARCFAYGGARGRAIYDPEDPTNSIQHFYDKLLRLRDGMHTAEGRRLAEARHRVMEQFLAHFWREWEGEET